MKKERTAEFMTMVSTGEKPDAEIHAVGFDEKGGVSCQCRMEGSMQTHAHMLSSMIDNFINVLDEKQGKVAVAAFVAGISSTIAASEHVDRDVLRIVEMMANPEKLIGALGEMLGALVTEDDEEEEE